MMTVVIATCRVAGQTSRWARLAAVTVEVVPAVADAVIVAQGVYGGEASPCEAACGAGKALRRVPTGGRSHHRVMVTDIAATKDTGAGDVYEASARAVWRVLCIAPPRSVGFSEPETVGGWLRDRIGRRLVGVSEARHWYRDERDPDPGAGLIHAWLFFDHRPPTRLHGCGDDLELCIEDPYPGYDMDDFGEVRVASASAPDLLASVVGRPLTDAAVILGPCSRPVCAGLMLRLDGIDVVIGTVGDEWVIAFDQPPAHLGQYWRPQPWITQG